MGSAWHQDLVRCVLDAPPLRCVVDSPPPPLTHPASEGIQGRVDGSLHIVGQEVQVGGNLERGGEGGQGGAGRG